MIRDFIRACLLVIVIGLVFANAASASELVSKSASTSQSAYNRGLLPAGDLQRISSAQAELISRGAQVGYFRSSQGIGSISAQQSKPQK